MKTKIASLLIVAAIGLAGCSGAKEQLGLTKKSPDEFAVVKRAPLSMPPDYSLRPPRPGAPRPQEQSPQEEARQKVLGSDGQPVPYEYSGSDASLLSKASAGNADPAIRQKIDAETETLNEDNRPVIKKLLGSDSPEEAPASVVDPEAEAERLKQNKEQGKPVTEGETPAVEQ